jgi:hypothetical protein
MATRLITDEDSTAFISRIHLQRRFNLVVFVKVGMIVAMTI